MMMGTGQELLSARGCERDVPRQEGFEELGVLVRCDKLIVGFYGVRR